MPTFNRQIFNKINRSLCRLNAKNILITMITKHSTTIALLLLIVLFAACKKEGSNSTIVNAASPVSVKSGQTVTITGQNLTAGGTPTATLNKRQLTVQN